MNKVFEKIKFKDDKEWLKYRKNHIGASDSPIIMGVAKWKTNDGRIKTPNLLAQEKWGLANLSSNNVATNYGKVMEEPARRVYESMVGDLFEPIAIKNFKYSYLMASLDGLNITEDRAVEIKNANEKDHQTAKNGGVPDKYYPQVQHQLLLLEHDEMHYFSFHKGEGIIVTVQKDKEYQEILKKELGIYWDCIETFKEPPLTEDDFIERGKDWEELAQKLYVIKQQKKVLCLEEKVLEKNLKSLSDHKNSYFGEFMYSCCTTIGRVDYKAIPELLNRDLSEFRSEPSVRWNLKKKK